MIFRGNRRRFTARQRMWLIWGWIARTLFGINRSFMVRLLSFIFIAVILVFGCPKAYQVLEESPHFLLTDLEIEGLSSISIEELTDICGIKVGVTNLLFTTKKAITLNCEGDERIRWANVEIELPNRLTIKIEEQVPIMYLAEKHGLYLVNQYGEVYGLANMLELLDLPILVSLNEDDRDRVIRDGLALVRTLGKVDHPWKGKSIIITYDNVYGYSVTSSENPFIANLSEPPFKKKIMKINYILDSLGIRGTIESLIVNGEETITIRLQTEAEKQRLTRRDIQEEM